MNTTKRCFLQFHLGKISQNEEAGFGLLEAIISALILAVIVSTSVTVTNKYQAINYRSSLRQAIAQTIDEDLTEIKLELDSYLYQKESGNKRPCYASSRDCQQSSSAVGTCFNIAQRAIAASSLLKKKLTLQGQTHKIFSGLQQQSSVLERSVSLQRPHPRNSALDQSIIRVEYTLADNSLAQDLFGSQAKKIIASIDLTPPAHSACQY